MDEYNEWIPYEVLPDEFYLKGLLDQKDGLSILLSEMGSSNGKYLKIKFANVLAYRSVQESGRLKTLGNPSFGNFNFTKKSEFIEWFKEEGQGIYDARELLHYAICSLDKIVDVISDFPPVVQWEADL